MSGKRSRNKGASGEREVCRLLDAAELGTTFRRMRQAEHGAHRLTVPDVDADDANHWPFWCEVKRQKRPNIRAALQQATDDCHDGRCPLAVTRADRDQWLATLSADVFLVMVRGWLKSEGLR